MFACMMKLPVSVYFCVCSDCVFVIELCVCVLSVCICAEVLLSSVYILDFKQLSKVMTLRKMDVV